MPYRKILNVLFPSVCLLCREEIADGGGFFCASCFSALRFITAPYCKSCGEPFSNHALGGEKEICLTCQEKPPLWHKARALFVYNEASKKLVLPLKYADRLANVRPLARLMHCLGQDFLSAGQEAVLVPVPLHISKLRSRRYNQAALLAQSLGKLQNLSVISDALIRCRRTQALAYLSIQQRHEELEGAFKVNKNRLGFLKDRHVILIDDILTTGATAEACVSALKEVGCRRVDLFVVARACEGLT